VISLGGGTGTSVGQAAWVLMAPYHRQLRLGLNEPRQGVTFPCQDGLSQAWTTGFTGRRLPGFELLTVRLVIPI
jgi:hypothetical protein